MTTQIPGGSFIIDNALPDAIMTPEDFTEEQRMFAETTRSFVDNEVLPHDEALEQLNPELSIALLRKAGELGLLGADVPEAYGGLGLDKVSSAIIGEQLARASSFGLTVGAHTGIGTLPIVFFGTAAQKQKYLPQLVTGEKIAAYCLTEPSSGSDALGAKTTARLSADGNHYILNGSKLFITNGGFADIFIVYAKIEGAGFSAFIVERGMKGFSTGPELDKMGIKGTSTVPLYFEDVPVPADHVLGEPGKGHLIAFNILNIGRFKLAAGTVGACKETIELAAAYANTRQQFGRPISSFPLIAAKLADMNIRTYVLESCVYRTSGLIDGMLRDLADHDAPDAGDRTAKAIAEYAVECSINKVFATEALDFVVDEGLQIHGGYGYIKEYRIERIYRDSRINRIFEGTNEINRLLISGTLLKKALKGELPLLARAEQFQRELLSLTAPADFVHPLDRETHLLQRMKQMFLLVGGAAVQKFGPGLAEEQEALASLADIAILAYAAESALLRTKKRLAADPASGGGGGSAEQGIAMTQVYLQEAFETVERIAKRQLAAMEEGDALRLQLSVLKKLARHQPANTTLLKRGIAARVIAGGKYAI